MEYVGTLICAAVILGLTTLVFSGYRLSKTVRMTASLLFALAVILPLVNLLDKDFPSGSFPTDTEKTSVSDPTKVYVDICKKEIESRLEGDDFIEAIALILTSGIGETLNNPEKLERYMARFE